MSNDSPSFKVPREKAFQTRVSKQSHPTHRVKEFPPSLSFSQHTSSTVSSLPKLPFKVDTFSGFLKPDDVVKRETSLQMSLLRIDEAKDQSK